MKIKIRVSVIIPVKNGQKYIEKAIVSALNNMSQNDEIIIVDDGSKDKTLKIVKKFLNYPINFTIVKSKNLGAAKARNIGLSKANGKFIILLDHDDFIPKNRIANHLKVFKKNRKIDIVSGFVKIIFKKNLDLSELKYKYINKHLKFTKNYYFKGLSLLSSTFKKKIFKKLKFNETYKYGEDTDLLLRIRKNKYKIYIDRKISYYYSIHGKNSILNKDCSELYKKNLFNILRSNIN
jgi:glycosyltransferase involved in cell wall biosynthesis